MKYLKLLVNKIKHVVIVNKNTVISIHHLSCLQSASIGWVAFKEQKWQCKPLPPGI